MTLRDELRRDLPENQRELLAAYGRFLRSMAELTQPASKQVGAGPAAFLLYAMWLREIQLGRGVQEICIDGFAQEAQMLARAMIGEALDVMLICEADSDPRALRYAAFARKVQRDRAKALLRHGHLTPARAAELEHQAEADHQAALTAHAAAGTRPAPRLGKLDNSWSGLSTSALAHRFNMRRWYDLFYSPFSDTAHVNAAAIDKEISAITRGEIHLGGRFDDPWLVVVAASEAISRVAEALDTFYGLNNRVARDAADVAMEKSLGLHASALAAAKRAAGS